MSYSVYYPRCIDTILDLQMLCILAKYDMYSDIDYINKIIAKKKKEYMKFVKNFLFYNHHSIYFNIDD